MRKTLSWLLVLVLLLAGIPALAEDNADYYDDYFVIGATTPINGDFFTNMWGNNTSDIDVRSLIHGHSPVVWTRQSLFEVNTNVVADLTVGLLDDGNKMYIVQLHDDLKFSDGSPITAEHYVFSLMLHASPLIKELGGTVTNASHIAGYEDYNAGLTDVFTGLRITGEYTFSVEINQEFLPFFFELSMIDSIPYPIDIIAPGCEVVDLGEGATVRNIDETITEPLFTADLLRDTILDEADGYLRYPMVSSGPYRLESHNPEKHEATFVINEYYKGNYEGQMPSIDNLLLKPVIPETMMEELAEGDVQLLNKVVAGENINEGMELNAQGIAERKNYPRMGFGFLTFANEQGPGQFEAVRKAVAYAVDQDQFVTDYTTDAYGRAVYGYYGIGQWMYLMVTQNAVRPEGEQYGTVADWDALSLSLEGLNHYDINLNMAIRLLEDDGWTLNKDGQPFVEGQDDVRYKMVDGELMGLTLRFAQMEDSVAAQMLLDMLTEPLAEIGMALDVDVVPFAELLLHYYRELPRTYDMMYLATNFISIFDPYFVFNTDDAFQGPQNTTGFRDEHLEALAKSLRETEPGDLLTYCTKWVAFQEYFNEKLPMIPLYSNIYFDFHIPQLQNYQPDSEQNWPVAILYAYLGEATIDGVDADGNVEIDARDSGDEIIIE